MVLYETMKILHLIGLSWGLGCSTLVFILNILSERSRELSPHVRKIMPISSRLTMLGLILLSVSGIVLAVIGFEEWATNWILMIKFVVVVVLVFVGILLASKILPKMQELAPEKGPPSEEFLRLKKKAMIGGILNLILWYVIVVLSVIM